MLEENCGPAAPHVGVEAKTIPPEDVELADAVVGALVMRTTKGNVDDKDPYLI